MSEFFIGTTDPNAGRSFTKKDWHKIEPGENFFRILPPVHSLAKLGRYYQYHAVHGGFKNKAGKQMKFSCIEEKDRNKVVTKRCPVCDMVNDKKKNYDLLKQHLDAGNPNVTKEKLKAYHDANIYPFQADKKNYVNAVDITGKIGILPIPFRAFETLRNLISKSVEQGNDITGIKGAFVNVAKIQRFKGDSQTTYSVNLATEQHGDDLKIKRHTLTAEVIEEMRTKTADLANLYRSITAEDMAALVAADESGRAEIVERLFPKFDSTKNTGEPDSLLAQSIPGTTATAVGQATLGPNGLDVRTLDVSEILAGGTGSKTPAPETLTAKPTPTASAPAAPSPTASQGIQSNVDLGQLLQMPVSSAPKQAAGTTPALNPNLATMSDDEFARMLNQK